MAAIGETFICGGGLSFIVSHSTIVACPIATFLAASCLKCSSASVDSAEACGPHSTASHISTFVNGLPDFAGHPYVAYSLSVAAAGWCRASPFRHISFLYAVCSCVSSDSWTSPLCVSQYVVFGCVACVICHLFLFSFLCLVLSLPNMGCPMTWNVGESRPVPYADGLVGLSVGGSAGRYPSCI